MSETSAVLATMLKENTGKSFLDSGDFYGRNWQRNQGRDFQSEESVIPDICICRNDDYGDFSITINVYHYLTAVLEYSSEYQNKFESFLQENDPNNDWYWLQCMEKFAESLGSDWFTENTYNSDSSLSQILQYTCILLDDCNLFLLQIHGGCDARGGYTSPKCFTSYETEILNPSDIYLNCTVCDFHADSDDFGYHYYTEYDKTYSNDIQKITSLEFEPIRIIGKEQMNWLTDSPEIAVLNPINSDTFLTNDDENKILCPICGNEMLIFTEIDFI